MSSLYIHIPFCQRKCLYCSFVSFSDKSHLIDSYLDCLSIETQQYKAMPIETLYIGGGTPTVLSMSQLERLFSLVRNNFNIADTAEVSIEANPATFDLDKARCLKECGVNRVSLGVQSLNNDTLKYLGRLHDRDTALNSFALLRKVGFDNINIDMMYSIQGFGQDEIKKDILDCVALKSEHCSAYTLCVGEGSSFFEKGIKPLLEDEQRKHYLLVKRLLEEAGFFHYEVSNFAKRGKECAHNLVYWHQGDYGGLGCGAHSHIDGRRFWNFANLEQYIECLQNKKSACEESIKLEPKKRLMEYFLMGLRLVEGVDLDYLEAKCGIKLSLDKKAICDDFVKHNFLKREGSVIKPTAQGLLVLDEMGMRLI